MSIKIIAIVFSRITPSIRAVSRSSFGKNFPIQAGTPSIVTHTNNIAKRIIPFISSRASSPYNLKSGIDRPLSNRAMLGAREVKNLSTSSFFEGARVWDEYMRASPEDKLFLSVRKGLELIGMPSSPDDTIETLWKTLSLPWPPYDSQGMSQSVTPVLQEVLTAILQKIPHIYLNASGRSEIHTVGEMITIINGEKSIEFLPSELGMTLDGKKGIELLKGKVKPDALLLEDGSGNGQTLVQLTKTLLDTGIPVTAIGTDIDPNLAAMGKIFAATVGIERFCDFGIANVLNRKPAASFPGGKNQRILLGFRMIPVLRGEEALFYLEKISKELRLEDYWVGSIALPKGDLYEKNSERARTGEFLMKAEQATSMGGFTFTYKPDLGSASDERVSEYLSDKFNIPVSSNNLNTVVANSYYTEVEFEQMVKSVGLTIKERAEVDCEDNTRLTVVLEKAITPF